MNAVPAPDKIARERAKLRRTILVLAPILIAGGILVLIFLQRVPAPLRILIGLGDIIVGLTLLVVFKQKLSGK